ncbi:hypothetical protein SAMN04488057_102295 [Cyclobacterium lianum]|uniref:Dolichyl-phosphate-mannose-protein mannosyltransferase n=2 Tax=Cyclobacterium lianum TaxID=388280 RepID=A0A1M7K519_9BACT|nr:hypothetical protein SAMN04488057_102295 [Cyclobacterium lianum]
MIGIFFLLILLRIPYYLMDIPITQPELLWQLLGERMTAGNLHFADTIDSTGPLSALVYGINQLLFENSLLSFSLISFLLILFQIFYTNELLIRVNAYEESNYLPAFIMVILYQLSFDFMTLSPALMGNTFLLLAMGQLLRLTSVNANTVPAVLLMGFWAGIAFCFHFSYLALLPFFILTGLLVNGFTFQQLNLLVTSYLLPFAACAVFYFWQDALSEFFRLYVVLGVKIQALYHVAIKDLLYIFSLPLLLTLFGYFLNNTMHRMNVNQQKQNQLLFLYLLFNIATFFLMERISPYQFVSIFPPIAYFTTHLFTISSKRMMQQSMAYGLLLIIPFIGYSWVFYQKNEPSFERYKVNIDAGRDIPKDSSVMVLDDNLDSYNQAKAASPYLNFRLTRLYFEGMDERERKVRIYRDLKRESPDLIIDETQVFHLWTKDIPHYRFLYENEGAGRYRKIR